MKIRNELGEVIKAGCIVLNEQGEILLVKGKDGNSWAFPKGHAERGETLKQVAVRETLEETGYQVELVQRLPDIAYTGRTSGEPVRVGMFFAKIIEQSGKPEEVMQWTTLDKAKTIIHPNLAEYLDTIASELPIPAK